MLRTPKRVFREANGYRIEAQDSRGNRHGSFIALEAVLAAMRHFDGRTISIDEAVREITPHAPAWHLPYTYGHKLRYTVQDLFVVMVAEGRAEIGQMGRGFVYSISAGHLSPFIEGIQENATQNKLQALDHILIAGENDSTEFKETAIFDVRTRIKNKDRMFDVLRSVAGFLNAEGGILLVGVRDDGKPMGLATDFSLLGRDAGADKWLLHLRSCMEQAFGNGIWPFVKVEIVRKDHLDIAFVKITKAQAPAFMNWQGNQYFFVRTLNATKKLDLRDAMDYIRIRFNQ